MMPRIVYLNLREGAPRLMSVQDVPTVLCLGNFDGVHRAHAALLREGVRQRDLLLPDGLCGVFCFFKPSSDYFRPVGTGLDTYDGGHLTPLREKLGLFARAGVDLVCLCDFASVRGCSPTEFLSLLIDRLGCRGTVCGFNYRFGVGGQGTADDLKACFDRPDQGRFCTVMPELRLDGMTVSSTRIRHLLKEGRADVAARLLGHPYALETTVVHGKHLGHTLGFPTANQYFLPESVIPAHGVYATLCHTPAGTFPGVSNVGVHPTVDDCARVNCETYLIGQTQELYGQRIRVEFLKHLRDEMRFSSLEELTETIRKDVRAAADYVACRQDASLTLWN